MAGWSQAVILPDYWPEQKEITAAKESEKDAKMIKEVICMVTEKSQEIYPLLKKFDNNKYIITR